MNRFVRAWRVIGCWPPGRAPRNVLALARYASVAALLVVYADAPAEESFGRLFFSIEERRTLDDMRDDDIEPERVEPTRGEQMAAPLVDVISFDGKVERSAGGGSTIWVNGRPVLTGNRTLEGIRIQSSRGTNGVTRFILPPSEAGETDFSLKAGQKIAVQSGKKLDAYEARAAEDAESVFAKESPADAAAPDGVPPPDGAGSSSAATPSRGS